MMTEKDLRDSNTSIVKADKKEFVDNQQIIRGMVDKIHKLSKKGNIPLSQLSAKDFNNPDKIREVLKSLDFRIKEFTMEMAFLLWWVVKNKFWKNWGYKTMGEYCEKEYSMSQRKMEMLVNLYEYYGVVLKDTPEVGEALVPYGYSKMDKLVGIVNKDNLDYWLEEVKKPIWSLVDSIRRYKYQMNSNTYFDGLNKGDSSGDVKMLVESDNQGEEAEEVNEEQNRDDNVIDAEYVEAESNQSVNQSSDNNVSSSGSGSSNGGIELYDGKRLDNNKYLTMTFKLTDEQFGIVQKAFHLASQNTISTAQGYLLYLICMSFISENIGKSGFTLNDLLRKIENMEKIKLIAIKDGAIIFGDDFVSEVILK
jgi:hypothetical protein